MAGADEPDYAAHRAYTDFNEDETMHPSSADRAATTDPVVSGGPSEQYIKDACEKAGSSSSVEGACKSLVSILQLFRQGLIAVRDVQWMETRAKTGDEFAFLGPKTLTGYSTYLGGGKSGRTLLPAAGLQGQYTVHMTYGSRAINIDGKPYKFRRFALAFIPETPAAEPPAPPDPSTATASKYEWEKKEDKEGTVYYVDQAMAIYYFHKPDRFRGPGILKRARSDIAEEGVDFFSASQVNHQRAHLHEQLQLGVVTGDLDKLKELLGDPEARRIVGDLETVVDVHMRNLLSLDFSVIKEWPPKAASKDTHEISRIPDCKTRIDIYHLLTATEPTSSSQQPGPKHGHRVPTAPVRATAHINPAANARSEPAHQELGASGGSGSMPNTAAGSTANIRAAAGGRSGGSQRSARKTLWETLMMQTNNNGAIPLHQLCYFGDQLLDVLRGVLADIQPEHLDSIIMARSKHGWVPYHNLVQGGFKAGLELVVGRIQELHAQQIGPSVDLVDRSPSLSPSPVPSPIPLAPLASLPPPDPRMAAAPQLGTFSLSLAQQPSVGFPAPPGFHPFAHPVESPALASSGQQVVAGWGCASVLSAGQPSAAMEATGYAGSDPSFTALLQQLHDPLFGGDAMAVDSALPTPSTDVVFPAPSMRLDAAASIGVAAGNWLPTLPYADQPIPLAGAGGMEGLSLAAAAATPPITGGGGGGGGIFYPADALTGLSAPVAASPDVAVGAAAAAAAATAAAPLARTGSGSRQRQGSQSQVPVQRQLEDYFFPAPTKHYKNHELLQQLCEEMLGIKIP